MNLNPTGAASKPFISSNPSSPQLPNPQSPNTESLRIDYKRVWDDFSKKAFPTIILTNKHKMDSRDYKVLCEEKSKKHAHFFKGKFQFIDGDKKTEQKFILTDPRAPIEEIRKQIGTLIKRNPEDVKIFFKNHFLEDLESFQSTGCNGWGSEVFKVKVSTPKDLQ